MIEVKKFEHSMMQDLVMLTKTQVEETLKHLQYEEVVVRFYANVILNEGDRSETKIYLAYEDGEPVGYLVAYVRPYLFTWGSLVGQEVVYVLPDKRGASAFIKLMQVLDELAVEHEAKECYAGVANGVKIDKLLSWFSRKGYHKVGYYVRKIL